MCKKTKILGIAPYEGMKTLMMRLAGRRDDIDLTVYVGDLETGAEIASKHTFEDYDVILSRGGTAEMISSISSIPVVEIQLSVYDILRAIKLAENHNDRYAIVGFPGITKNAHFLCDLLQYNIDIYTIHNSDEVYDTLIQLTTAGYHMVLCDVITSSQAQRLGMRSILFTSGSESVETAFDQAVKTAGKYQALISKVEFFRTLLEDYPYYVFVYSEKEELIYSSKQHNFSPAVITAMKNYVSEILKENSKKFYRDDGDLLVAVKGIKKQIYKQPYVVYYVNTRKVPLSLIKNGIRYIDKGQALEQLYANCNGLTNPFSTYAPSLDQMNHTGAPAMILGEDGTGKEEMAAFIYSQSKFHNRPMAIIDCSRVTDKGWQFLTEHTNSPLSDTDTTIYIREIESLSDRQFKELFSIIRNLNLHRQNHMIFSCTTCENEEINKNCRLLMNHFNCLSFTLPPLRANKEDVPDLANLYISNLNMQLAKEIVGLEPNAVSLLKEYDWPGNYSQFKRIMTELFAITDSSYIKAASVSKLLLKEHPANAIKNDVPFDLNRTLEEINLDIARHVLAEEKGNQSQAAKRLGISRTTLWRMLQQNVEKTTRKTSE